MSGTRLGVLVVAVLGASVASAQQVTVGAGSSLSLSNAKLNLGCSDLVVTGAMNTEGDPRAQQGLER